MMVVLVLQQHVSRGKKPLVSLIYRMHCVQETEKKRIRSRAGEMPENTKHNQQQQYCGSLSDDKLTPYTLVCGSRSTNGQEQVSGSFYCNQKKEK